MVVELCDRLTLTFSFSASTAPIECVLRSPLSAAPRGSEQLATLPEPPRAACRGAQQHQLQKHVLV